MAILLVEDERSFAQALKKGLEIEHYSVDVAYDGDEGLRKGTQKDYDIIMLDLMLPKMDGIEVCKELRRRNVQTPIIMITARDRLEDRVEGLDSGADDYLVKPFDFDELLARTRSLLRRKKTTAPVVLKIADLELNPATHEVKRAGKIISITPKEYELLDYLMRYPNRAITRQQLLEHIWQSETDKSGNTVDVHIRYLRRKIDDGYDKKLIHTVRGAGYKIKD